MDSNTFICMIFMSKQQLIMFWSAIAILGLLMILWALIGKGIL
jgi:hypothetical protein